MKNSLEITWINNATGFSKVNPGFSGSSIVFFQHDPGWFVKSVKDFSFFDLMRFSGWSSRFCCCCCSKLLLFSRKFSWNWLPTFKIANSWSVLLSVSPALSSVGLFVVILCWRLKRGKKLINFHEIFAGGHIFWKHNFPYLFKYLGFNFLNKSNLNSSWFSSKALNILEESWSNFSISSSVILSSVWSSFLSNLTASDVKLCISSRCRTRALSLLLPFPIWANALSLSLICRIRSLDEILEINQKIIFPWNQ